MIVHRIDAAPPPELVCSLASFEEQFRYPLGLGRTFRISHGEDYGRFFRAMGVSACFVAVHEGSVVGTIGSAIRRFILLDGSERFGAYVGDLKATPGPRRGHAVLKLIRAVHEWAGSRVDAAFSVVMDGTTVTPENYAGRVGVPALVPLGKIVIFQLRAICDPAASPSFITTREGWFNCHRRLRAGRCTFSDGNPEERSDGAPQWLAAPDGSACGVIEDTLRAKRLFADDGTEIRNMHLSCFAYDSIRAGTVLIQKALRDVSSLGFNALFVAIAEPEAASFAAAFADPPLAIAPATIYGTGLASSQLWNINPSEI